MIGAGHCPAPRPARSLFDMPLSMRPFRTAMGIALAVIAALPAYASAQRRGFGGAFGCGSPPVNNLPYDGRFTFARLMYTGNAGNCYYRGEPSWAHGYG